jgi:hypothetical protein
MELRGGSTTAAAKGGGLDIGLMLYFLFWYVGNYYVSLPVVKSLSKKENSSELKSNCFCLISTTSPTRWHFRPLEARLVFQ